MLLLIYIVKSPLGALVQTLSLWFNNNIVVETEYIYIHYLTPWHDVIAAVTSITCYKQLMSAVCQ